MYERCLNEAELILSTQKDPLVPVREIWEEVVAHGEIEGFEVAALPDFSAMLEGDRRFQIIPGQKKNKEDQEESADGALTDSEMENLGFFSEDRVRLRIARIVQPVISEDEEEVGSIRRRAFASQTAQANKIVVKKQTTAVIKNSTKKKSVKKASSRTSKSLKKKVTKKSKSMKTRTRRKK